MEQAGEYHNHALDTALKARELLSGRKSRLVDTFTSGDIDEALYREKLQEIDKASINLSQQIKELEKSSPDPRATIELKYSVFKRGNTMAKRYADAPNDERRIILSEALSNSTLLNREIVDLQYKSPFDVFARTPQNASFSDLLRCPVLNEIR